VWPGSDAAARPRVVERLDLALLVGVVVADRVRVPVRRAQQVLPLAARDDGAEHLAQDLHQFGV
jgi:hypothetical protein